VSDATRYPNLTAALAAEAQRVGRLQVLAESLLDRLDQVAAETWPTVAPTATQLRDLAQRERDRYVRACADMGLTTATTMGGEAS
jgi:uncharacterized coiled-coil protein SlyX